METTANKKPEIPADHEIANPSCKNCYGTGYVAQIPQGPDKKLEDGTVQKAPRSKVTCSCVSRAKKRRAPWLQRHGVDRQPWLQNDA